MLNLFAYNGEPYNSQIYPADAYITFHNTGFSKCDYCKKCIKHREKAIQYDECTHIVHQRCQEKWCRVCTGINNNYDDDDEDEEKPRLLDPEEEYLKQSKGTKAIKIHIAAKIIKYKGKNKFNIDTCCICQEAFNSVEYIVKLKCSHIYHLSCNSSLIKTCPYCRVQLT